MNKKIIVIIVTCLVCLMLATCLVACGENGGNGGNNGNGGGSGNQGGGSQGESTLKEFEGIKFEDVAVVYDGQEHSVVVENLPAGASVAYASNTATAVGEYQAKAVISKEGYKTLTLNATLTIMPKEFEGLKFASDVVVYDGQEHSVVVENLPEGASVAYTSNTATDIGEYQAKAVVSKEGYKSVTLNAKLTVMPSASLIVESRKAAADENEQNYDFFINLNGTVDIKGVSQSANGNYDGKYRFNKNTGELKFRRETSGLLLYDSIEYIYSQNDSKIKLVQNEKQEVKKISVVANDEEELNLMNLPFVSIVNALEEGNISEIKYSGKSDYKYTATLSLHSDNALLSKLYAKLEKMGTRIDFKGVEVSNPMSIKFDFNLDKNHKLTDFKFGADVSFPVKGVPLTIAISYKQSASDKAISLPSANGFVTDKTKIGEVITEIDSALARVKQSSAYSLDLTATNEFDPGWNVTATTDKYFARLYKNTTDGRVDFNHSFKYKAHNENDDSDSFKFTLGNIQNGDVYLISRKGTNTQTKIDGVSVNTQFDLLTSIIKSNASSIDCIKKVEKDGSTFYYLYQNNQSTYGVQSKIVDLINSNPADEVTDVQNYFNAQENEVVNSEMVVEIKNGQLVAVNVQTDLRYCPTGGEYTEENILLTNKIELTVNEKLEKAQEYVAPENVDTKIGKYGLNNAKFYLL